MARSVTKAVLITSVPLLVLAGISILSSSPRHAPPVVSQPLKTSSVAFLHLRRDDQLTVKRLVAALATPPVATPVPPRRPPAVAARPKPVPTAPHPVSGVGGSAGVEFSLVNQDRAANGVPALAWSGSLARVAQYRAEDMLNRNYFSHTDPATGQLAFVQLLHLWGIPYSTAGENIAWSTNPSMAGINTMFMNSPDHRANILKAAYHRVGIGVATNGTKTMVVEVFSN